MYFSRAVSCMSFERPCSITHEHWLVQTYCSAICMLYSTHSLFCVVHFGCLHARISKLSTWNYSWERMLFLLSRAGLKKLLWWKSRVSNWLCISIFNTAVNKWYFPVVVCLSSLRTTCPQGLKGFCDRECVYLMLLLGWCWNTVLIGALWAWPLTSYHQNQFMNQLSRTECLYQISWKSLNAVTSDHAPASISTFGPTSLFNNTHIIYMWKLKAQQFTWFSN